MLLFPSKKKKTFRRSSPSHFVKINVYCRTWAISLIGEVSTVVSPVALPCGVIAEGGELALLKCHSLHSQAEITGTVGGSLKKERKRHTHRRLYSTARSGASAFFFFLTRLFYILQHQAFLIPTYCSSSHHSHPHSPLSGHTCWSLWCNFHLCTGTVRVSTALLTSTNVFD